MAPAPSARNAPKPGKGSRPEPQEIPQSSALHSWLKMPPGRWRSGLHRPTGFDYLASFSGINISGRSIPTYAITNLAYLPAILRGLLVAHRAQGTNYEAGAEAAGITPETFSKKYDEHGVPRKRCRKIPMREPPALLLEFKAAVAPPPDNPRPVPPPPPPPAPPRPAGVPSYCYLLR